MRSTMSLLCLTCLALAVSVGALGSGCPSWCEFRPEPDTVPDFEAATFTNPTQIDNPYMPLVPGVTRTYEADTEDGLEETVVEVLADTREVAGVLSRVVRDRVYLDGHLIEDTHDWFAQDDDGNVWYMGEEVDNYNYDESWNLIDITHEGAWEAGEDVAGVGNIAKPGIVMEAAPEVGDVYNQEYYRCEAEDMAEVISLSESVEVPYGSFDDCLQTEDWNPLEADSLEEKTYATGVGLVLEENPDTGERTELISVEGP